jgi:hypothetical protein
VVVSDSEATDEARGTVPLVRPKSEPRDIMPEEGAASTGDDAAAKGKAAAELIPQTVVPPSAAVPPHARQRRTVGKKLKVRKRPDIPASGLDQVGVADRLPAGNPLRLVSCSAVFGRLFEDLRCMSQAGASSTAGAAASAPKRPKMVLKHQLGTVKLGAALEASGPSSAPSEGARPAGTPAGTLTVRPPLEMAAGQGALPASAELMVQARRVMEGLFAALTGAEAAAATAGRSRELALRAHRGNLSLAERHFPFC